MIRTATAAGMWEIRQILWTPYYYSCLLVCRIATSSRSVPQRPSMTKQTSWRDAFDCRRVSLARTQLNILTTSVRIPKRLHKLQIPSESYIYYVCYLLYFVMDPRILFFFFSHVDLYFIVKNSILRIIFGCGVNRDLIKPSKSVWKNPRAA